MSNKTQIPATKIIDLLLVDTTDLQLHFGRQLTKKHNPADADKFRKCDKVIALLKQLR